MVGYTHHSKTWWRLWDPECQTVKTQSEVIFDEERNAHLLCQHGSNEIDMFGLPEDEEYVKETDTGDKPHQDSQPMQIGEITTSHMHEAPDEAAQNADSRRIRQEDLTAKHSEADAVTADSWHNHREDPSATCILVTGSLQECLTGCGVQT